MNTQIQTLMEIKTPYTKRDLIQDVLMWVGGLAIIAFWLYQVGQNMIYLAK